MLSMLKNLFPAELRYVDQETIDRKASEEQLELITEVSARYNQEKREFETAISGMGELFGLAKELESSRRSLKAAKNTWERTFNTMNSMIVVIDKNGIASEVNNAYLDYFNKTRADVVGKEITDFYDLNGGATCRGSDCIKKILKSGKSQEEHLVYDSERFSWLEIKCLPLRDSNNEIYSVLHIADDVTERERLIQKNEKEKKFYKTILDDQIAMISRFDEDWKIIFANRPFCKFLGVNDYKVLIGKQFSEVWGHTKEFVELLISEFKSLSREKNSTTFTYTFQQNNEEIKVHSSLRVIYNGKEKPIEYQLIVLNLSDFPL